MLRIFLTVVLMIIPKKGLQQDTIDICSHVNVQNKLPLKITGSANISTAACSCIVQSDGINVSVDSVQLYESQQNATGLFLMDLNLYVFSEDWLSMAVDEELKLYSSSNGIRSFKMKSFVIIWNPVSGNTSSVELLLSDNHSSFFNMLCIKHRKIPWFDSIKYMNSEENTRNESLDGGIVAGAFIGGFVLGLLLIAGAGLGYRYWKCGETPSPVRSTLKRLSLTKSAEKNKNYGRLGEPIDHQGIDTANKSVSCRATKNVILYSPESPPVIQIQETAAPNCQRRGKSTRNPNMPVEIRHLALYRNMSNENLVEENSIQHRTSDMAGEKEQSTPIHSAAPDASDNSSSSIGTRQENTEQSTTNLSTTESTDSMENIHQIDHLHCQEELSTGGVSPSEEACKQNKNEMKHDHNYPMSEPGGVEPEVNTDDGYFNFTSSLNIGASEGLEEIKFQHDTNKIPGFLNTKDSDACYENKGLDED